MFVLEN